MVKLRNRGTHGPSHLQAPAPVLGDPLCAVALPSFCIAVFHLRLGTYPAAVAGMICAIATFVLLYAILTTLAGPLSDENHLLARALKLGTKIRAIISCVSTLLLATPVLVLLPDTWCGLLAVGGVNWTASKLSGDHRAFFSYDDDAALSAPMGSFLPTFTVTMVEGFILSFLLLLISFFAVIGLQARERRRMYEKTDPHRAHGL